MAGSVLRDVVRAIAPPIVVKGVRRLSARAATSEWRLSAGWPDGSGELGWAHPEIAEANRRRWQEFSESVRAPRPLGHSNEAEVGPATAGVQNTYLAFAYALARACGERSGISMLDWGGGLGQYLVLAAELFPELEVSYTCKEQPSMVALGGLLLPEARFTADASDALAARYDLVVASGSLHYEQDWTSRLVSLAEASKPWLYVTRLPVVHAVEDFVLIQRAHAHGYPTEYPGWALNRTGFLRAATSSGLVLQREFLIDERPAVPNAPEQPEYRGFLFKRQVAR